MRCILILLVLISLSFSYTAVASPEVSPALTKLIDIRSMPYAPNLIRRLLRRAVHATWKEKSYADKLIGQHVYYVTKQKGIPTLRYGLAAKINSETGIVEIKTADKGNSLMHRVHFSDINSVAVSDHSDLNKRVSLIDVF